MIDNWYITPKVGKGTPDDQKRPKYSDTVNGYSALPIPNENQYVVRYHGNEETLHDIAKNDDVEEISDNRARGRLNKIFDRNRSIDQWHEIFRVSNRSDEK